MKRKTITLTGLFSLIAAATFSMAFSPVASAAAFDLSMLDGANAAKGVDQATTLFGNTGIFTTLSNVMLFLVGAISVIMVIIGGFRYVVSGGNSGNITAAKNTILYAVVGLVIAIMAYAIINFVIASFVPGMGGMGGGGTNV